MAKIPLYKGANPPSQLPRKGNVGLWYDKYYNKWNDDWSLEAGDKLDWISTVAKVGRGSLLQEKWQRIMQLIEDLRGENLFFRTRGRFVIGLGRNNPVESGFSWHYGLGVPYLPGSSVKGMVRAWVELIACDRKYNRQELERVFGSTGDSGEVGTVIFFSALPYQPVLLEPDVMTPHYGPYYREEGPPADWHKPIPIPFLTVAAKQVFGFPLAPRRPAHEEDFKRALQWLEEALDWIGAGAKTAVGYGRFERDKALEEMIDKERKERLAAKERKRELAEMSPLGREMEESGYNTNPHQFIETMGEIWIPRLEDESLSQAERKEIAGYLAKWYQENRPCQWRRQKRHTRARRRISLIKSILKE